MRPDSLDSYASAGERLLDAARRNPEALLLLAAGGALLLRHGTDLYNFVGEADDEPEPQRTGGRRQKGGQSRRQSGAAGRVRRSLSDAADAAGEYVADVTEYASELGERASRLRGQARSSASDLLEHQPFAVAALGLAAGAAVAALLPPTPVEKRSLRGVRETVDEMVSDAADKLTAAASDAGRRMQQRATQAATAAVMDAAKTFSSGLTNKEDDAAADAGGDAEDDRGRGT